MAKLLIRLLIIIVPFIVGFAYLEIRLSEVENSYKKKRGNFLKLADSIEIICMGNSHVYHGIDPSYFSKKGFNLANSSQDIHYDRELLLRNLPSMPRLKIAILSISHFSLFLIDMLEPWRNAYYKHYWGFCNKKYPTDLMYYSYTAMYGQDVVINEVKSGFKKDLAPDVTSLGFLKSYHPDNVERGVNSLGWNRVKGIEQFERMENFEQNISYISEMIEALQKRGVAVVLITMPVLPVIYNNINPKYYNKMQEGISLLCEKYNIRYYNYLRDSTFATSEFYDNDHLNYIGAAHFTRMIDSGIIRKIPISEMKSSFDSRIAHSYYSKIP